MVKSPNRIEPKFVRRIGIIPLTNNCYGLCDDGNVWIYGQRLISNCGPLAEFTEQVKAGGRWRIILDD